jgi:EpsI family protein
MRARALIVAALVIGAAAYVRGSAGAEARVAREPLDAFPWHVAGWQGQPLPPLDGEVLRVLGADEYLNRRYVREGAPPIDVYVGYYRSQRQGDVIHSPQNCLPGAGWQPVQTGRTAIRTASGDSAEVNRYVVQKGLERRLVLYWYQGRGHLVASEYANKAWLVVDALRMRRSDGALVRFMTPLGTGSPHARAEEDLRAFAAAVMEPLGRAVP